MAYVLFGNSLFTTVLNLIMPGRFGGYINRAEAAAIDLGMTNILYVLFFLFCVLAYSVNKEKNEDFLPQLRLSSVAVVITLISAGFPNLFRIGYYFVIFLLPLFSEAVHRTFVKKQYGMICFMLSLLLAAQYILLGPGAGINNYQFFWK